MLHSKLVPYGGEDWITGELVTAWFSPTSVVDGNKERGPVQSAIATVTRHVDKDGLEVQRVLPVTEAVSYTHLTLPTKRIV